LQVPLTGLTNVPVIAGPFVAGFVMTYVMEGRPGILHFLWRFVLWRVNVIWYVIALLGPMLLLNLGLVVQPGSLTTFTPPTMEAVAAFPQFFFLVLFIGGPFLEEPGWRGFALPRMQKKWGPLIATLILGVLWAAWHFPLFLLPVWAGQNGGFTPQSVALYTANVVAFTFLFTWLFNHTRGSLLLVILLHTGINVTGALIFFQGSPEVAGLIGLGLFALALALVTRGRLGYDTYLRDEAAGLT
jgi:membrane protease YdiL (CAAX protease family)